MNPEEAKVPNIEKDWQSIEIFLFSNGQQYSPPRKYLLRVDELNLWDATLNQLAQSHYGLQSPLINLYTTNGHLVKGPLDLRDGHAYVAVAPPETFVDAGYQKYLIRASRSWEKRQARKKPAECVPDEPCCLCPEKERSCCDPQACCLCPEREDADSLEHLLPVTGHPELRPAGGHYMSSAPAKPVTADDYEPVSGKIDRMTCEHCENRANPREYEYSPVPTPVNLNGHDTRLGEDETRHSVNRARPDEFGARPTEYETKLSVNEVKPGEYGARTSMNGTAPGEYRTRQTEYGARPNEYETKSTVNETKPGGFAAKLGEYETHSSINGAKPGEFGARLGDEKKTTVNGTKLGDYGARQFEYDARPNEYETKPSVNGSKPVSLGPRPGEYAARPSEYGVIPGENAARPSLNGARQGEFGAKPAVYETKPSANGAKPGEYGARPGEYETRPSLNGVRPGEFGTKPAEYETKPSANGGKPEEYDVRPGKYETRPSVNGTSHAEYESEYRPTSGKFETKPSVNEVKPGEYGTRRDENKTKPNMNGVSPDEKSRAKPAKYEPIPKVNGAKPGEYGTRQGEYETEPSVNVTRSAEFLAIPVGYATRSAEQENRPGESNLRGGSIPSPAKNGSWSGEYGDRMTGHKARPGHSGPWSGKIEPIKEAYEIALREKEKKLKESEDKPDKDTVDKDASIKCVNEYATRETDQREKEIEPKDRSRGNGGRGGERRVSGGEKQIRGNDTVTRLGEPKARKIDNTRKLSGRGGAEIEQGARNGEQTRAFEHGGRVSAQKARETNPTGRASWQGARPSEQKNKQSDNVARFGGRESRVGDHEARAGDLGFQTSGHDAGLENTGSREAEPGTRAAISGLRASPRDRLSSRAKTGNLGQPKIGRPGTKIDEASVKLGDSEVKHREGNSGARLSRVGGTGTAGALHISEAQQHARRNTLLTGRPSIEKKRLSIGQNSSLLRKPPQNSSMFRKSEDGQPIKINTENLPKKMNEKASPIPVPASNGTEKSKTQPQRIAPPPLPPSIISITNIASLTMNKDPLDNVIDEKEITVVSTHSFKNPESETKSMMSGSLKQAETQTELIYIEKSMAYVSVNEEVQTNTEEVEQQGQEVSTSKEKDNSCTCSLCRLNHKPASDLDENTLSMLNKGGVVNIKLNIEVRNIVKSVYSCHKNCGRSRSLTNVQRPEKESEISIEDKVVINRTSLQSLFTKQNFGGFGFEGSPKVMVVQCAGCGKLNTPPLCDPPPCCDSNKKYFVLLNSVLEDIEDGCNLNPPCRPCDQRQSRKQSIPMKQAFSETTLDTITTVTVSGVPLQRREMGKYAKNTSCQTEEPQNECMATKRKVSITEDSVTKCDLQKKSSSSVCVATQTVGLVPKQSCLKMFSQKCEYEDSQVCSELCRAISTCEKVRPNCSQVPPLTCEKVLPDCSQVSPTACENVQPDGSQVPPPNCEIVRLVCSQIPSPTYENVRPDCSQVPPPKCEKVRSPSSQEPLPTCEKVRSVCSQIPPPACEKVRPAFSSVPPPTCENVQPVCSQEPLPICENVRSLCSQIPSPTCEKVSSQTCSQVQTKGCMSVSPTCRPPCYPKPPPPCLQIQAQACPSQHSNAETQTRWGSILARLHCDGRYSFHLPPLHLLKSNRHSCCQ